MKFLTNIFNLFYPKLCLGCSSELLSNETILCAECSHNLPFMNINNLENNQIIAKFYGRIPLKKASSFLYYKKHNITQELIHQLKYKGNEDVGEFLGRWYANELKKQDFFNDVDYIIPVPLFYKKLKIRGYNQVEKFGKALSSVLNIDYCPNILQRTASARSQTKKDRTERFLEVENQFHLTENQIFKNKHVLLIDDVITTGATIEACCKELLKTENITISLVSLAYTTLE